LNSQRIGGLAGVAIRTVKQVVAQICNLLYRRIAFCNSFHGRGGGFIERRADYKSAIQQIENLRYDFGSCPTP
jgi:hypothetical protein